MGQPGLRGRTGEDAYNIAVGGTCRRGRVALFELDVRRWTPRGIPGGNGYSIGKPTSIDFFVMKALNTQT